MARDTKTALLEAAKTLVSERGYAGTSVRELAAAADVNLAAVNYHFGSREELLDQAVLQSFLEWTDRFDGIAQADPNAGPFERMSVNAQVILDDFPDAQPLFAAFLEALLQARRSPELRPLLAEHYAEQRRRVGEVLASGTSQRERSERTSEILASVLIAVVDGLLLQSLVDPAAIPTGAELAALTGGLVGAGTAAASEVAA